MNKYLVSVLSLSLFFVAPIYSKDKMPTKAQINGDFVRVRNAPKSEGQLVGILYKNMIVDVSKKGKDQVKVGDKSDYWYRIKQGTIDGWCFGGFLDFELKNGDVDTYSAPSDLAWFFERFGHSTWEYKDKIDITSFTLDEYRSLMAAVMDKVQYSNYAALALRYSIYEGIHEKENVDPFPYLKQKIYSKEFAAAMMQYYYEQPDLLSLFPDEYKDDKAFISNAIKQVGENLPIMQFASERLQGDRELAKMALEQNGTNMQYLPEKFKDDRELALIAINNRQTGFQYISDKLRDDREIAEIAINQMDYNYRSISPRLKKDKELAIMALKINGFSFRDMTPEFKDNEEIVKAALDSAPSGWNRPEMLERYRKSILEMASPRLREKFSSEVSQ